MELFAAILFTAHGCSVFFETPCVFDTGRSAIKHLVARWIRYV